MEIPSSLIPCRRILSLAWLLILPSFISLPVRI
jgi:hypothetical protein